VDGKRIDKDLSDQALRLAADRFEERVGRLVTEAQGDRTQLAMAAARLSTIGPTQGDSKERIAFALLMAAAHRAAIDVPPLKAID
jgi:hypothetical protein